MLAVAVDIASPFIWAGAVVVVGGVSWVISTATKTGIGSIVKDELKPVHDRMTKLEEMLEDLGDGLAGMRRRKDREYTRIWDAIDDLRRRSGP